MTAAASSVERIDDHDLSLAINDSSHVVARLLHIQANTLLYCDLPQLQQTTGQLVWVVHGIWICIALHCSAPLTLLNHATSAWDSCSVNGSSTSISVTV